MKLSKKLSLGLISTTAALTPVVAVVSCGSKNEVNFDKKYDFSVLKWDSLKVEDVTIDKWVDGDTFTCTNANNETYNVRIQNVDTPESHVEVADASGVKNWVDTEGLEHEYAIKAFEFGQDQIKPNSKARLVLSGGVSYNRKVASVFYGENFSQNYEVNILRSGLAMPFVSSKGLWAEISPVRSILHYLAIPLGNAYNYAVVNHLGLFGADRSEILKIHGSTDTTALEYNPSSETSVFNYVEDNYWK